MKIPREKLSFIIELTGIFIASMSCIGTFLAVPFFQDLYQRNSLAVTISFVVIVVSLLSVVLYINKAYPFLGSNSSSKIQIDEIIKKIVKSLAKENNLTVTDLVIAGRHIVKRGDEDFVEFVVKVVDKIEERTVSFTINKIKWYFLARQDGNIVNGGNPVSSEIDVCPQCGSYVLRPYKKTGKYGLYLTLAKETECPYCHHKF